MVMESTLPDISQAPDTNQIITPFKKSGKFKTFIGKLAEKIRKFPLITKIALVLMLFISLTSLVILSIKPKDLSVIEFIKEQTIQKPKETLTDTGFKKLEIPQKELPFFTLTPSSNNKFGILPADNFTLTSKKPVSLEFIQQNVKSNVAFTTKKINDNEYRLSPTSNLELNSPINIQLPVKDLKENEHQIDRDYGWTYQTQERFHIIGTIPANDKIEVPVNSGIEFKFSQDDYKDPTPFLSIVPAIEFQVERHENVFSIVPKDPLQERTRYQVTLKKGLNLTSRNNPINDDYTFSFVTGASYARINANYFYLDENFIQVTPKDIPSVKVNISSSKPDSVTAEIFKFSSSEEFMTSYSNENKTVKGLPKIGEAVLKIQNKEELDYLQLPAALEKGFYLVQFWTNDKKNIQQLWIQSTFLSAYLSVGRKQTLVWANDISSSEPVKQGSVEFVGSQQINYTNNNGITVFSTPERLQSGETSYIRVKSIGDDVLIIPSRLYNNYYSSGSDSINQETRSDYWSYFYHERTMYLPTDNLNFWGIIKRRDDGQVPEVIEVKIGGYRYSSQSSNVNWDAQTTVTPARDGSFIGSINLKDLPQGYHRIVLVANGNEIEESSFTVNSYTKPEMKMEVVASKKAIFTDEKVNFTVKTSFFDETPVRNVKIKIASGNGDTEQTTNEKGEVSYDYQPVYQKQGNYPRYDVVTFYPTLAQKSEVEQYGSVIVYGERMIITTENKQTADKAEINVTINNIVLDGFNKGTTTSIKGDPVGGKEVTLTGNKIWWEKKQTGTYYDFIEKTTRPSFTHEEHREKMPDTRIKTDSEGKFHYEFNMENQRSYQIKITFNDGLGHEVVRDEYFYYYQGSGYGNEERTADPMLTLSKKDNNYSLGEEVGMEITYKGEAYPQSDKNRFLFILAQRGRQDFYVQNNSRFSFTFADKNIPNVNVGAMVFNGSYYRKVGSGCQNDWGYYYNWGENYFNNCVVNYRSSDSDLDLSIKNNKESYNPGDTAEIKVKVSKKDQAVSDAQVNLVLVDEALVSLGIVRKPSILTSLYKTVPHDIYFIYYTHKPLLPTPPQAEMGGGGGEERTLFKDIAYFGQSRTDQNGEATLSFKIPDNITNWVVYAQALGQNLDAGQTEGGLISTKNFFITNNFPNVILKRDKAFVTANSWGNVLGKDNNILYNVTFFQNDQEVKKLVNNGLPSKDVSFAFPDNLTGGSYKVSVNGKTGNLEDGVLYPGNIIDSRLNIQINTKEKVENGREYQFAANDFDKGSPVKIVISDIGKGRFFNALYNFCYTSSNRLEKNLAAKKASDILIKVFKDEGCNRDFKTLSSYQNNDGGLSEVNWGSSLLETTAWGIFVDPDLYDKDKLKSYLNNYDNSWNYNSISFLKTTPNFTSDTYLSWARSLLGESKINDLKLISQKATNYKDKVLSAIALATLGEKETAREIYLNILADYAYENKPYIRIQANNVKNNNNNSVDQYVQDTGYALLLSSMVDKNYNEGFYNYVRDYEYNAEDVVLDLGKISFITEEMNKQSDTDTLVSFTSASRAFDYKLTKGKSVAVKLLSGEESSAKFKVVSGKAEFMSYYSLTPQGLSSIQKDDRLKIRRTYRNVAGGNIKTGDIVEVRLDFDLDREKLPAGPYIIKDSLPSGLIFLENPTLFGFKVDGYMYQKSPNVIEGTIYNSDWWWQWHRDKFYKYYAIAKSVGTYIAEPAAIQYYSDLSILQSTAEDSVIIEGSK